MKKINHVPKNTALWRTVVSSSKAKDKFCMAVKVEVFQKTVESIRLVIETLKERKVSGVSYIDKIASVVKFEDAKLRKVRLNL